MYEQIGKILCEKSPTEALTYLSTVLNDGGHLTHGSSVSFSSYEYDFDFFPLGDNERIDFNLVEGKIKEFNPDVLLTGYSAYPYEIDFAKFKELADKYNCLLMVDMAHIAGLVAAGEHQSPVPYADIVTTTTHKTLRGPRGGLVLTNNELIAKKVNSAVFPYSQGGPLEHVIAGKALCFEEALQDNFKTYIKQVKENTKVFADTLKSRGVVCSDTENHLVLINVKESFHITGLIAQEMLEKVGITTNKNMIHNDTEKPSTTSGLRIGFAALTSRGCDKTMAKTIAEIIFDYLSRKNQNEDEIKSQVLALTSTLTPIEKLVY